MSTKCFLSTFTYLNASTNLSTFWASPWTFICAWNFLRASSRSIPEKSISSTTQLRRTIVEEMLHLYAQAKTYMWIKKKQNTSVFIFCAFNFSLCGCSIVQNIVLLHWKGLWALQPQRNSPIIVLSQKIKHTWNKSELLGKSQS